MLYCKHQAVFILEKEGWFTMKLYSIKQFITAILAAALMIINFLQGRAGRAEAYVFALIFFYFVVRCLYAAFTHDGYQEVKEREQRDRTVYRQCFGVLAPVAPWFPIILLFFTGAMAFLFPQKPYIVLAALLITIVYIIGEPLCMRKAYRQYDEQKKLENGEKTEIIAAPSQTK